MIKIQFLQVNILDIITVIAFVLTVIAFGISIFQSYQARQQTKQLESQTNDLKEILGGLSTRFVGTYPEYLDGVISLLGNATKEIKIICSIPTPHIFGNPAIWLKYEQTLEKQSYNNTDITFVTLTQSERKKRLEKEFFNTKNEWKNWMLSNRNRIENFVKRYFQDEKIDELTYDRFIHLLLEIQDRKLYEVYKSNGINVIEYENLLPIHIWIVDNKEAIFSIQNTSIGKENHGFRTLDQSLITALYKMIELFTMTTHKRIDIIVVTKNLDKSVKFYRDIIGLEMRPLSNPVAIFKYDYASLYIYQETFFEEQFGIESNKISANGMLSIQITTAEEFKSIIDTINKNAETNCEILLSSDEKYIVKDFNNFVIEIWK